MHRRISSLFSHFQKAQNGVTKKKSNVEDLGQNFWSEEEQGGGGRGNDFLKDYALLLPFDPPPPPLYSLLLPLFSPCCAARKSFFVGEEKFSPPPPSFQDSSSSSFLPLKGDPLRFPPGPKGSRTVPHAHSAQATGKPGEAGEYFRFQVCQGGGILLGFFPFSFVLQLPPPPPFFVCDYRYTYIRLNAPRGEIIWQ